MYLWPEVKNPVLKYFTRITSVSGHRKRISLSLSWIVINGTRHKSENVIFKNWIRKW